MNKYTEYKTCALLINEEYLSRASNVHTSRVPLRSDIKIPKIVNPYSQGVELYR